MFKCLVIIAKLLPVKIIYAHCDIPCGIYDPHTAQMAAHTVIRMTSLIEEAKIDPDASIDERKQFIHRLARLTKVKEEHAELIKHEIRVLWADYFKSEHLKDYPNLHDLVFETMKLASRARQEINLGAATELLEAVLEIAEIFFQTKGLKTIRVSAPYPTGKDLVLPR